MRQTVQVMVDMNVVCFLLTLSTCHVHADQYNDELISGFSSNFILVLTLLYGVAHR